MKPNKKLIGKLVFLLIFAGAIIAASMSASPSLNLASKLALLVGILFFVFVWSFNRKIENIFFQSVIGFVGRFGIWLFMGYLLYAQWRLGFTLLLTVALLPFDILNLYRARERKLDDLNTQNLPSMNFDLK